MKYALLSLLTLAAALAGCEKKSEVAPRYQPDYGLEGTWQLISRQCYCPAAPVPNETLTFTATTYAVTRTPQPSPVPLFTTGTYNAAPVTVCGAVTNSPGLAFADALANIGPRQAQYVIHGDTLVLNYGGPCDAPVDMYKWLHANP